jgi:4-amino-4-deoxy-L-arabinose transferase-like glycosyltransferase
MPPRMDLPPPDLSAPLRRLRGIDLLLVALLSFALFGYCGISGRPLTMHEARLPQTSREMLATHQWLLPHSGIRPWLERPPLPHWFVIGSIQLLGRHDAILPVWIVRLPSALMGTLTVLLTALMAGRLFGRGVGVMSGLLLATSFEFYRYAGSAEDDIYLAALVAAVMAFFCVAEFAPRYRADRRAHLAMGRTWPVLAFFLLLGLTNWAKGPLLGMAVVGATVGCYLLWNAVANYAWRRLLRYLWLWGWLLAGVLTLAWPAWAYHRYPDVIDNWKYDYLGRFNGTYTDINQPWNYYLKTILWTMAPWTPACAIGLLATARRAVLGGALPPPTPFDPTSRTPLALAFPAANPYRFIWCWAIAPLILFSIPHGKHHHYLLPFLAPWAILGAFGLIEIARPLLARRGPTWLRDPWIAIAIFALPAVGAIGWFHARLPGPSAVDLAWMAGWTLAVALFFLALRRASAPLLLGVVLGVLFAGYCWAETFVAGPTDQTVDDTAFLHRVATRLSPTMPLYINARLHPTGNLDFFRIQFYTPPTAVLLHNLSYLRDEKITAPTVYVITRAGDAPRLATLGETTVVDQSLQSHEQKEGGGPFTLFRLRFAPNLRRYPATQPITNLQAMGRAPAGPWLGPAM